MFRKSILSLLLILILITNGYCATGWLKTKPAGTSNASDIDTNVTENNAAIDLMLSKYRDGCSLSYASTSTITVGSGGIMISNSDGSIRLMVANTSNTTVTWANIDTGAEANSTTYYIYAIASSTTATTFTCVISTNSSAPTGYTYYRKLGSFYNDASGNITLIATDGEKELGDWVSRSVNTTYQASTDGFVLCYSATSGGITVIIYVDTFTPPTTIRIQNGEGYGGSSVGTMCPVKKGDYWKVSSTAEVVYWIPLD